MIYACEIIFLLHNFQKFFTFLEKKFKIRDDDIIRKLIQGLKESYSRLYQVPHSNLEVRSSNFCSFKKLHYNHHSEKL